jgi:hypothetical protein
MDGSLPGKREARALPSPVRSPPYWSGLAPPTSREGRCSGLSAILLRREEFGARAKRGFLSYDGRLCEAPYSHRLILAPLKGYVLAAI